jgi:hypothetical protein
LKDTLSKKYEEKKLGHASKKLGDASRAKLSSFDNLAD